ncbi:hypothetical protein DFJ74DRAFT_610546 [Hyaloraphidium curvatum]|nr:hypothetical protein DFJ74DRAFT_610546 [Hyaloraphidium curvatum]
MHGARVGARGAILGYFLRGGVDFLLRLLRILRGKASLIQAIRTTFGSSDALRTAWFFGTFSFLWKSVYDLSTALWKLPPERAGFAAGTIAGLALVFESKERRVGIAQQVLVRGLQAAYNTLKAANRFSFPNGDAFLFIVCSAQIMYSYVRHPEALPPTFYSFIRDTGPIPEPILKTVRAQLDGDPVPADLAALVKPYHPSALALETISRLGQPLQVVDCCLLHSHTDSCAVHGVNVFTKVFKLILPVYGILTTVPTVVFRFGTVLKRPAHMLRRIAQSTIRSSVFLGAFVSGYQEFVCMVRYLIRNKIFIERDAKALYWIAGAFASLSIFLEEKSRRTELALYTLPRAVESWYLISYGKGWVPYLPFFEVSSAPNPFPLF